MRLRLGKSRKDVAAVLKITETHAGRLERGKTPLSDQQIEDLAKEWNIPVWEFQAAEPSDTTKAMMTIFRTLDGRRQRELLGMAETIARFEAQKRSLKKR